MGQEIKFDISKLQSQDLRTVAESVDEGNTHDGKIDDQELQTLQQLLNGSRVLAAEVEKETDDIKALLGYSSSASAAQAKKDNNAVTPATVEAVEDDDEDDDASSVVADSKPAEGESKTNKTPYETVIEKYYQYRGIDMISREPVEGAQEMSPQAAYEAVEKDFKGDKTYKKALKNLRKYSIDTESKLVVMEAIAKSDATKSKDVKKDAKEILEEKFGKDGKLTDKHLKKALNGKGHSFWANAFNWLSGRDSGMKKYRKAQAYGNRAENKAVEPQTKEAMTKAIGKRSPLFKTDASGKMMIENLVDPRYPEGGPLVIKNGDKYDISKLVAFVGKYVGADNTLSRQENGADSELVTLQSAFNENGLELSKRDTKQLVEFCGYKVEGKNFVKTVFDGTIGAGAGALGTSVALFTQAPQIFSSAPKSHVTFDLDFKFVGSGLNELIVDEKFQKLIDSGAASMVKTASNVKIHIDHTEVAPFTEIAKKHIGLNALKAAGIGALTGIAAGLLEYGPSEKNVLNLNFEYLTTDKCLKTLHTMTYKEFASYVDARTDLKGKDVIKQALKQLALLFNEEKGWNGTAFKAYLAQKAGNSSNLNEIELLKAVQDAPECLKEKPVEKKKDDKIDDKKDDKKDDDDCPTCPPKTGDKPIVIPPHKWDREGGESWVEIVKAKYPCLFEELQKAGISPWDKNGAIKVMQRALATDENGVFHKDKFKGIIRGDIPAHLDFPDTIEIEVNGKKITCKYEDNPVKKKSQKELQGKGGSIKSNNGRYGYGRKGNLRTYTDECHPKIVGEGKDDAAAKADFERKVKEANAKTS